MAHRMARVSAGMNRKRVVSQSMAGSVMPGKSAGMPPKREPMVSTGSCKTVVARLPMIRAMMVPGMMFSLPRTFGWSGPEAGIRRCQPNSTSEVTSASPSA